MKSQYNNYAKIKELEKKVRDGDVEPLIAFIRRLHEKGLVMDSMLHHLCQGNDDGRYHERWKELYEFADETTT